MRNSTILYWVAFFSFISAFYLFSTPFIRMGDSLLGVSIGSVVANLLLNFRKEKNE